jgi:hypothetical protein
MALALRSTKSGPQSPTRAGKRSPIDLFQVGTPAYRLLIAGKVKLLRPIAPIFYINIMSWNFRDCSSESLDQLFHLYTRRLQAIDISRTESLEALLWGLMTDTDAKRLAHPEFVELLARLLYPEDRLQTSTIGGLISYLFPLFCSSPIRRVRPLCVSTLALLCRFSRRSHEEVQSSTSAPYNPYIIKKCPLPLFFDYDPILNTYYTSLRFLFRTFIPVSDKNSPGISGRSVKILLRISSIFIKPFIEYKRVIFSLFLFSFSISFLYFTVHLKMSDRNSSRGRRSFNLKPYKKEIHYLFFELLKIQDEVVIYLYNTYQISISARIFRRRY